MRLVEMSTPDLPKGAAREVQYVYIRQGLEAQLWVVLRRFDHRKVSCKAIWWEPSLKKWAPSEAPLTFEEWDCVLPVLWAMLHAGMGHPSRRGLASGRKIRRPGMDDYDGNSFRGGRPYMGGGG